MNKTLYVLTLTGFIFSFVQPSKASLPPASSSVYHLQSYPGASRVIYLDFDGQYVNSNAWKNNNANFPGQPINALASNVDENDIITIWKTIREDYLPFQVNVTTDSMVYKQAAYGSRQMCIFTPTYEWCGQLGITLEGSFSYDEPCFAFTAFNKGKAAAEVGSHEIGHSLGLTHDGVTSPPSDYFNGHGTSPNDWSAIMGGAHTKNMIQWSKGEYQNANNQQDDLAILAAALGGYRTDEAGTDNATAVILDVDANGTLTTSASNTGIITTRTDTDVYSFTTTGGKILLQVFGVASTPDASSGNFYSMSNLDILLQLKDASNNILVTSDDQNSVSGSISMTLAAGTYYLYIDGTGYADPLTTGYTDYGSIGEYTISGSIPVGVDQIPVVRINANDYYNTLNTDNYFVPKGGILPLKCAPSDPDGTIVKVDFYDGNTFLGSTYSGSGYEFVYYPTVTGLHAITAKATDANGNVGISPVVTVDVFEPIVTILSPVDQATYTEGDTITINALADVHFSKYIINVTIYDGATLLTSNTSPLPPYTDTIKNATAGVHILNVTAEMSAYSTTGSSTVTVTVKPSQPDDFTVSTAIVPAGTTGVTYTVPADPDATYIWTYSGSGTTITSVGTSNSIILDYSSAAASGTLSVVAVKNGVSSDSRDLQVTVIPASVTTGTSGAEEITALQVKPNPSSGIFVVSVPAASETPVIKIIDVLGKTVYEKLLPEDGIVDLTSLPGGTYNMIVQDSQYNLMRKIIIY